MTEFCVLPIGSQAVKNHAPLNMSTIGSKDGTPKPKCGTPVLIVGAPGTGKKMLVNAVCNETGANLFNLTPSNTDGKYPGKKAYDMVHTVFKVAKALAPSVVWIDEVDAVFKSGKVKGATGEPPNRIMKQLTAVLSPKKGLGVLDPEDRVLIIGTSSTPYATEKAKDVQAFKDFFSKILMAPLPTYSSRLMLWCGLIEKHGVKQYDFDEIQTLATVSAFYSTGSIAAVVANTLTQRRVERLARKPFQVSELLGPLAKQEPIAQPTDQALRAWYHGTVPACNKGGGEAAEAAPAKDAGKKKK